MYETNWAQPDPSALLDPAGPPIPDTEQLVTKEPLPEIEAVLSELGALYPVVAYPSSQVSGDQSDDLERTIYAGLVNQ
jgi:hypothetical protein